MDQRQLSFNFEATVNVTYRSDTSILRVAMVNVAQKSAIVDFKCAQIKRFEASRQDLYRKILDSVQHLV